MPGRKWKASWPKYKILVVANESGTADYYPFHPGVSHKGENFWIGGEIFKVRSDNSIHLSKTFMKKFGYIRPDGRRALILEAFGTWHPLKYEGRRYNAKLWKETNEWLEKYAPVIPEKNKRYVQGARIWYGKSIEKCYMEENGDILLIDQRNYVDLHFLTAVGNTGFRTGGWLRAFTKDGFPHWYHPQFLITYPEEE